VRDAFDSLATSCRQMLANHSFLKNTYLMKCALSQFMLLPSMYVHVRDGRGVYKKLSFEKARKDFCAEEWVCMDRVSHLRNEWQLSLNPVINAVLSHSVTLRSPVLKALAPSIPKDFRSVLTPTLIGQMVNLIERMQGNLDVALLNRQLRQDCIETRQSD